MKNSKHGGKRKGAGRKSGKRAFVNVEKKEKTKVVRIPVGLLDAVEEMIEHYNELKNT